MRSDVQYAFDYRCIKMILGGTIGKRFAEAAFENYEVPPGSAAALEACQGVAKGGTKGIILHGPVGLGKTHLFVATALSVAGRKVETNSLSVYGDSFEAGKRPYRVAYWPILELVDEMRSEMGHGIRRIVHECCEADLLLFDDMGEERATESGFVEENLAHIINSRYNAMLPIGISTNLSLKDLKVKYSDRAFSRWWETCVVVEMKGKDYRTLKKEE